MKIRIDGIQDVDETIKRLNSMTQSIDTECIKFTGAAEGSLVLNLTVVNKLFINVTVMEKELKHFLCIVFTNIELQRTPCRQCNAFFEFDDGKFY